MPHGCSLVKVLWIGSTSPFLTCSRRQATIDAVDASICCHPFLSSSVVLASHHFQSELTVMVDGDACLVRRSLEAMVMQDSTTMTDDSEQDESFR